jgi:hypothetical protein
MLLFCILSGVAKINIAKGRKSTEFFAEEVGNIMKNTQTSRLI